MRRVLLLFLLIACLPFASTVGYLPFTYARQFAT